MQNFLTTCAPPKPVQIVENRSGRKSSKVTLANLLGELRPTPNLFHMASEMFKELWEDRARLASQEAQAMKAQVPVLEQRMEKLLNRLVETDNRTAIQRYETEISRLESEKIILKEKIEKCGRPTSPFEDCFRTSMTFLSQILCQHWSSDSS
jgi:site-specific DNA recombinase